jgi:hypothetical protein
MDSSSPKGSEKIISNCTEDHPEIGTISHIIVNLIKFIPSTSMFLLVYKVKASAAPPSMTTCFQKLSSSFLDDLKLSDQRRSETEFA